MPKNKNHNSKQKAENVDETVSNESCDTQSHENNDEQIKVDAQDIEFVNETQQDQDDNNSSEPSQQIDALKKELKEVKESNLRIMAEFDNFRKRSLKEKEQLYPIAVSETLKKILPFIDNFDRALEAETTDENYKSGFTMIFNQLNEAFKNIGVSEIDALGKPFDPELHNAVLMVDSDELESNTVAEILQKGYEYDGKVLRHAVVKVVN